MGQEIGNRLLKKIIEADEYISDLSITMISSTKTAKSRLFSVNCEAVERKEEAKVLNPIQSRLKII